MVGAEEGQRSGAVRGLVLALQDNVCVLCDNVVSGEGISIDGALLRARSDAPLGHKIALLPIAAGERVVKCGVPIGSATRAIEAGEHVHSHNLRSDYIPTFALDDPDRAAGR